MIDKRFHQLLKYSNTSILFDFHTIVYSGSHQDLAEMLPVINKCIKRWQVAQVNACTTSTHCSKRTQPHGGSGRGDKTSSIFGSIINNNQGLSESSHCGRHWRKVHTVQGRWQSTWVWPGCNGVPHTGKIRISIYYAIHLSHWRQDKGMTYAVLSLHVILKNKWFGNY